jgi:hypothetical protein
MERIREPIIIRKVRSTGYEATGKLEGHGIIRSRGRSEEEAKNKFFEACNAIGRNRRRDYSSLQART